MYKKDYCKRRCFIFSCENDNELKDLITLIKEEKGPLFSVFWDLRRQKQIEYDKNNFDIVLSGRFSWLKIILLKITFRDIKFVTGVSLFKFRLYSVLLRLKHISYLRASVLFDSKAERRVELIKSSLLLKKFNFLYPYSADSLFVVDSETKEYISRLTKPNQAIKVVNSIARMDFLLALKNNKYQKTDKVVFVTTAFSWHGYTELSIFQIEIVNKLYEFFGDNLVVRMHPRDLIDHYRDIPNDIIDDRVHFHHNDYFGASFITTISTLPHDYRELWIDGFYIDCSHKDINLKNWYSQRSIKPYSIDQIMNNYAHMRVSPENELYHKEGKGPVGPTSQFSLKDILS
jgi:hypothetical protein